MMKTLFKIAQGIDRFNAWIGKIAMSGIFILLAILLWSSISKTFFLPSLWTLEMAQFVMVAYYILGGPYSIQLGSNVRMDLFYTGWSEVTKAKVDAVTAIVLAFYLGVLIYGAYDSLAYSFEYSERSSTSWRPYLWPIKTIIIVGVLLMLLQAVSEFFKDLVRIFGGEDYVV